WSPDGERIVVIKGPRGPRISEQTGPGYELAWLPAAGGPTTRITPIVGGGRTHFSRDPNRIYLYEANEGLVSMRYDGTDRRVHIKVTACTLNLPDAQPLPADEIVIAPDSSRVLATASNYVYLVTLPLVGATPPAINVSDTSAAPFPVHRLTRIGGDFIGWGSDGRTVHWSIGRSFFRYAPSLADSLARLKARTDSVRADSLKQATKEKSDSVGNLAHSRDGGVEVSRESGVGRHHDTRSADLHHRRPHVRRSGRGRRAHRTPDLPYRPRRVRRVPRGELDQSRRRAQYAEALQRVLPHEHDQAVHGGEPEAASVGDHGGAGARPDAHDRRRAGLQDEPDRPARRLPRVGAQLPDHAALHRRGAARRAVRDHLHPDAARVVRRAIQRELLLRALRHSRQREDPALHPARRD